MGLLTFLGPFTDRNYDFPSFLYPSTSEIPTLLLVPEARKKVPILGGASPYRL